MSLFFSVAFVWFGTMALFRRCFHCLEMSYLFRFVLFRSVYVYEIVRAFLCCSWTNLLWFNLGICYCGAVVIFIPSNYLSIQCFHRCQMFLVELNKCLKCRWNSSFKWFESQLLCRTIHFSFENQNEERTNLTLPLVSESQAKFVSIANLFTAFFKVKQIDGEL